MPDRVWAGGAVGNWNLGANWAPAGVPGPGEKATINLAGGATVTGDVAIDCNRIDIGETQASNILICRYDVKINARIKVFSQANNQLRLNGLTRDIDVETPIIECYIADGVRFEGVVDLHGKDYDDPCVIESRGGDFVFYATADVEMWWIKDNEHSSFGVLPAGARLLAWRGVQLTILDPWEIHVAGVRYEFSGSYREPQYSSGGVYAVSDRMGTRSRVRQTGRKPKIVAWSGAIDDATYKYLKDELHYWHEEGTVVTVFTRDAIITGKITDFGWRPTGAHKDSFYYFIEVTEAE